MLDGRGGADAEVAGGADEGLAEVPTPDTIHEDAGGEGGGGAGDGAGEFEAAGARGEAGLGLGEDGEIGRAHV